jgi:hypothetical protein
MINGGRSQRANDIFSSNGWQATQGWYAMLRRRLRVLRWVAPLALFGLVVAYQYGPSVWLDSTWGPQWRNLGALLFYGTVGPGLLWLLLELLGRWLDERETSELQAAMLMQARQAARVKDETSDTALQKLFAAHLMIESLAADTQLLSPAAREQLRTADQALEAALQDLKAGPSFMPGE